MRRARGGNRGDTRRRQRQQRRRAQPNSDQLIRWDELQLGVDAAASIRVPSSVDVADDESFSAIDFHTHHSQHWMQAQHMDSADDMLMMDDAVCTPTHPHGRPVRRRQPRPASSPAPTKHQKGMSAADHKSTKQTDRWAVGAHYHMQQYTQPPSPAADDTRVITIQQLRLVDGANTSTHSTDDDESEQTTTATGSSQSSSNSGSRRRRRLGRGFTPNQSISHDSKSPLLGCTHCLVCNVLLPDDSYLGRHVSNESHQQLRAAFLSPDESALSPVWRSWVNIGRSLVQAPSKSSRRNAKKRTHKIKQHAHKQLGSHTTSRTQPHEEHAMGPASESAQPVDAAVFTKPVASLMQQLDETVEVQAGSVQCGIDWLSALLLRLQTADSSIRRDLSLSTSNPRGAASGYEEKESLSAPASMLNSEASCSLLADVLLSRCLCVPYPTDILAAACQLLDTTLSSPTAQQRLIAVLLQQQSFVPAVCSFNSWLCTLLAQSAQSSRAVQCDDHPVAMFTLLSNVLLTAARTRPSAGAALLRVMAVCGLLSPQRSDATVPSARDQGSARQWWSPTSVSSSGHISRGRQCCTATTQRVVNILALPLKGVPSMCRASLRSFHRPTRSLCADMRPVWCGRGALCGREVQLPLHRSAGCGAANVRCERGVV